MDKRYQFNSEGIKKGCVKMGEYFGVTLGLLFYYILIAFIFLGIFVLMASSKLIELIQNFIDKSDKKKNGKKK